MALDVPIMFGNIGVSPNILGLVVALLIVVGNAACGRMGSGLCIHTPSLILLSSS